MRQATLDLFVEVAAEASNFFRLRACWPGVCCPDLLFGPTTGPVPECFDSLGAKSNRVHEANADFLPVAVEAMGDAMWQARQHDEGFRQASAGVARA